MHLNRVSHQVGDDMSEQQKKTNTIVTTLLKFLITSTAICLRVSNLADSPESYRFLGPSYAKSFWLIYRIF